MVNFNLFLKEHITESKSNVMIHISHLSKETESLLENDIHFKQNIIMLSSDTFMTDEE